MNNKTSARIEKAAENVLSGCLFYLAPGGNVWWPVMVKNDMVEFPFNKQKFHLSECPGKFSYRPDHAAALRAIPSEKRAQASRENGKRGGRPKTK